MQIVNNTVRIISLSAILIVSLFGHNVASAQTSNPSSVIAPQMQIIVSPELPKPNTQVSLEAKSYSVDMNALDITWYANGVVIASGYGLLKTSVKVGAIGSETRIRVIGRIAGATVIEGTSIVRPVELQLILEANSSSPFWFQGRKLPSPRGSVRITAFPSLAGSYASLTPKILLYTWQLDNSDAIALAGVGAQSFTLNLPKAPAAVTRVRVAVTDPRGTYSASSFINVVAEDPHLTVFTNRDTSMARSAAGTSVSAQPGEKLGLTAIPFYTGAQSTLTYRWTSNGQNIPNHNGMGRILLTMPSAPTDYTIAVLISNTTNAFESIKKTLSLRVE